MTGIPHTQMALLVAMDAACDDITAESCRGWIRHSRRYFPRCIARDDIRCDVDETMWPDREERLDVNEWFTVLCMLYVQFQYVLQYCLQLCTALPKGSLFVVNKGVFILLHNAVNKLELQRAYAVKMWNIHIQCLVLRYLTKYSNV